MATDADSGLLKRAQDGRYRKSSLKELPQEFIGRAFDRKHNMYFIHQKLKKTIKFVRQDIHNEMPHITFNMILCRNLVLTYFEEELQTEIVDNIVSKLQPGGFLIIGSHESLPKKNPGPAWFEF